MPVNFSNQLRNRLLRFLRVGKARAINASTIANHMGFPVGGNQVKTRNLIRECIEHDRDLIGSTLSNPKGFYRIDVTNVQEFHAYIDSLENRAIEINDRRTWLINNWINGGNQNTGKLVLRLR